MLTAPTPARSVRRLGAPALTSRALFRYQARRMTLDAVSGHVGTLVRAATATAVDGAGTTYTAQHSMPRWEARDRDGDGGRDSLGLRIGADDLTWPVLYTPQASTVLFVGAEVATRTVAGAALWYLGNDGQTGARMYVDTDGTNYRAALYNGVGTDNVTVSLTGAAPAANDLFRILLQIEASEDETEFRIRLVNDVRFSAGEVDAGWSGWIDAPTAWGTGAKMRVGRKGSAGTQGDTWLRELAHEPGVLTADQMEQRL